jgi:hypothetical protein
MQNNNFCPLWSKGIYIEKVNQTDAAVSMCCFQQPSKNIYDKINFYTNDYLSDIRNTASENKLVDACSLCYENESVGNRSYRIGQINAFKLYDMSMDDTVELTSMSYNCENSCNLKCITCGPQFSSKWRSEYKKLGYELEIEKAPGLKNALYDDLDFTKLKLLHFQGGEPLLTNDHENILKRVSEQQDMSELVVSYNTNGTIMPSQASINLWRKTAITKLYFSIDGVGDRFDYIRFPGNWKQVESNIFAIRDLAIDKIWMELGITVSISNLFYLQEIIDWRDQHFSVDKFQNNINIYINFAGPLSYGGKVLDLHNIDEQVKIQALKYLDTITDKAIANSIRLLIEKVNTNCNTSGSWIDYLEKVDNLRKTNWKNSLRRLYEATQ